MAAFERTGGYWHMLPEANQARKAIWNAVNPHTGIRRIDEAFPPEICETRRDQDMFIRFKNGSTWQVVGSDNYDSLVGSPPVGIVFSEWSLADPNAWAYLRPILLENGGWALFIYTPRGRNHAAAFFEGIEQDPTWFGQKLPVTQTDVFTAEQLAQEEREYLRDFGEEDGRARFQQEYHCSFQAAVLGAYFGREMIRAEEDGRLSSAPYEPSVKVTTAWDLGMSDATAIWFMQAVGKEMRLIDYYESSGEGLDHYAKILSEKRYVYDEHLLPHDVEVKELGTGVTRKETLESLGLKVRTVKKLDVADGINAARLLLPKCWFDLKKCQQGINALREYRKEWDDKRQAWKNHPLHDWTSHAADAFRYLAVGWKEENPMPAGWRKRDRKWIR